MLLWLTYLTAASILNHVSDDWQEIFFILATSRPFKKNPSHIGTPLWRIQWYHHIYNIYFVCEQVGTYALLMASQRRLQSKPFLFYLPLASDGSCFSSFGNCVLVFCGKIYVFLGVSSTHQNSLLPHSLWFVMCAVYTCDMNMQLQMGKGVSEAMALMKMALMKSLGGNIKLLNIIIIIQS